MQLLLDLVTGGAPDFEMLSVMLSPSEKQVNITPFSTLIVKAAQKMRGGLSDSNVAAAKRAVLDKFGFGLDPTLIEDPITTSITEANVANMVKASEALGEMVRRTRDRILATGSMASGDIVMDALAADMQDGVPDGRGAAGTSPKITALANVVSGTVLVEALSNNLKVGGVVATAVMDQAIFAEDVPQPVDLVSVAAIGRRKGSQGGDFHVVKTSVDLRATARMIHATGSAGYSTEYPKDDQ